MSEAWETPDDLPDHLKTPDQRKANGATPEGPAENGDSSADTQEEEDEEDENDPVEEHIPLEGHREFIQQQRLEDILRAQREARQAVSRAPAREAEINSPNASTLVDKLTAGEVKRFISVIEEPLKATAQGDHFWRDIDLGTIEFEEESIERWIDINVVGVPDALVNTDSDAQAELESPTSPLRHIDADRETLRFESEAGETVDVDLESFQTAQRFKRATSDDDGEGAEIKIDVNGLKAFKEIPSTITIQATYEKELPRTGTPLGTETGTWEIAVPRRVSEKAVQAASSFLAKVGLDLEPEESDEFGIEIEEV